MTFARVAVQSEDKSSTEIALRLLVEGWDESFLVSWGPSSLWHRGGPENLPKIMTLEPGEKKIGQLQFRIPFDEAVESELHCRLIVLKVRAEEEVAVYALDHPERTPAERERIEITIEPGEHDSILLTPCISDSRTGTHLAASLDGVKVINNDRDATVAESMWLQINGVQPIAKLRIGNTNPSIPGRDYSYSTPSKQSSSLMRASVEKMVRRGFLFASKWLVPCPCVGSCRRKYFSLRVRIHEPRPRKRKLPVFEFVSDANLCHVDCSVLSSAELLYGSASTATVPATASNSGSLCSRTAPRRRA